MEIGVLIDTGRSARVALPAGDATMQRCKDAKEYEAEAVSKGQSQLSSYLVTVRAKTKKKSDPWL